MSWQWKITITLISLCVIVYLARIATETTASVVSENIFGVQFIGILFIIYLCSKNLPKMDLKNFRNKDDKNKETGWYHGTAGFASQEDIKDLITDKKLLEKGEIYLGETEKGIVRLERKHAAQHLILVGATGTGKSRGYFLHNCSKVKDTSIVVTDPKSELWRLTSGYHKKAVRYAPTEAESECFNWIPLCRRTRWAQLCARAVIECGNTEKTDQFWIDAEVAFLAALFAHTSTLEIPTPLTAYRLFTRQKIDKLMKQLLNSSSEVAKDEAMIFSQTDAKIRGGIIPGIGGRLQFMQDEDVARFTSAKLKSPNFTTLRDDPMGIYWCLREQDISRLRPLTSLFFTVLLEQVSNNTYEDGMLGTPVTLFLDEFANVGKIPDFHTLIALARGRGISICLGVQSLSQLEGGYGKANSETMVGNCWTKIALHGLDVNSAEYISKTLGDKTVVAERKTKNDAGSLLAKLSKGKFGGSTSYSTSEHKRPLLTPDEVNRISDDEAVVKIGNRKPFILPKKIYTEGSNTAKTSRLGAAQALNIQLSTDDIDIEDIDILDIKPPKLPVRKW